MEAPEPRGAGPQHVTEAGTSLLQVYGVYCYIRHVPSV
jgi:hypothetical protein